MTRYFADLDLTTEHPTEAGHFLCGSVRLWNEAGSIGERAQLTEISAAQFASLRRQEKWDDGHPAAVYLDPVAGTVAQEPDTRRRVRILVDGVEADQVSRTAGDSITITVQAINGRDQVDKSDSGTVVLYRPDRATNLSVTLDRGEVSFVVPLATAQRWKISRSDTVHLLRPAGATTEDLRISVT